MRDLYALESGHLLMVASDRISAYDFVLTPGIPDKGEILTRMSLWWFEQLADLVPNHVVSTHVPERVRGRALVCERLDMFPVECVARGYLAGSGLLDYDATGAVCGVAAAARAGRRLAAARADLHARHQGRRSASTTRTSPSTPSSRPSGRRPPRRCAT